MPRNPQIVALNEVGTSVWYDNLSRDVLRSGELKGYLDLGVSGLTSNPTIFKQAIADTSNYDSDIRALSGNGLNADEICEELMIQDVGAAADLLIATYNANPGADGHASIEVSPTLAHDTQGTLSAARRLWKKLSRPNIMIKVPATEAGIPAIRTLLEEGINVNVTLIFSREVYATVAEAHIQALESRVKSGQSVKELASVASFFVSRVDAAHEKRFDELVAAGKASAAALASFWGKVGIANSKLAYAKFEELYHSPRFAPLATAGARVQRPLWASTGTKNPKLSPTLYVEQLAGRDTVNTMPPATLKAVLAGATITPALHAGLAEAQGLISHIKELGLQFDSILLDLQMAGVKSFADSYSELISSIETKRKAI